jgi:periplasmic protein TonB
MFLESFTDAGACRPSQRRWATLISFAVQALAVLALLILPLFYIGALPPIHPVPQAIWSGPAAHAFPHRVTNLVRTPATLKAAVLQQPRFIPTGIQQPRGGSNSDSALASGATSADGAGPPSLYPAAGDGASPSSLLIPPGPRLMVVPAPAHGNGVETRLVISHLTEGMLLRRVDPEYPRMAKLARIQGQVLLTAVINKNGEIEKLQAVSGPPLLIKAALAAVSQWRYRPYIVNGQPCEVETQITVNFRLGE